MCKTDVDETGTAYIYRLCLMHAVHHPIPIGPMPNSTGFSNSGYLAILIFTTFWFTRGSPNLQDVLGGCQVPPCGSQTPEVCPGHILQAIIDKHAKVL